MRFIGVDVGVEGGIAILEANGAVVRAVRMPDTDADLCDVLRSATSDTLPFRVIPVRAVLEKVHSSPQMGVVSAFTFGGGYRACRMALTALGIPFDEVTPFKWQRKLECLSGGDKRITKARAQQLFPQIKVTLYTADSLLLAEYARRTQWPNYLDPSSSTPKGAGSGKEAGTRTGTVVGGVTERIENHGDNLGDLSRKD